jgi:sulfoxide reductase heme-binding subunit YedZ
VLCVNAVATQGHLFWITSRAAGIAALLFASAAAGLGLTASMKLLKGRGPDLRVLHEALSLATMAALVVHVVSLLGDGYLSPSVADLTIPFVSGYRQPWMSIGIVAHSLGTGTDAGLTWFVVSVGLFVLPVLALLALRLSGGRPAAPTRAVTRLG